MDELDPDDERLRTRNSHLIQHTEEYYIEDLKSIEKAKHLLASLEYFAKEARPFGRIAFRSGHGISATDYTRDWALIDMDPDGARPRPRNTALLSEADVKKLRKLFGAHPEGWDMNDLEKDGEICLRGPAPKATQRASHLVWKMGPKIGMTVGVTTEIEAVVRTFQAPEEPKVALELIVIPTPGSSEHDSTPLYKVFSRKEDSGASVCNASGQVVGVLTWGLVPEDPKAWWNTAITFVTPIEEIMSDIQRTTGKRLYIASYS